MTPALLNAFWTHTLTTAVTSRPNNVLILSSATPHGFRQSTRALVGMGLEFLIVMLLYAGISFSLAMIDPAAAHPLSWAGAACIVWLAWKIATSPAEGDGLQAEPVSFWVNSALQFVNVKATLYGVTALSTSVLPQTQALNWIAGISVLLAIIGTSDDVCQALAEHLFQRLLRQCGRRLNIVLTLLLVYYAARISY